MNQDLNKNLSRLGKLGTASVIDRPIGKVGSWVTSVVMVLLLPVMAGLMYGVYVLVKSWQLPEAVIVVSFIILFLGWIIGGGLVGNWVCRLIWGGIRRR